MSGMVEVIENIGGNLRWSSMADNASFGLEYLLQGRKDERTNKLLKEGVEFCTLLVEGGLEVQSNSAGLQAYLMTKTLSISIEELSGRTPNDIIEEAKKVKESLLQAMNEDKKFSEEEIRKMQRFFNEASAPYLREAFKDIRKIEVTRRKSSNVRVGRIVISRFT